MARLMVPVRNPIPRPWLWLGAMVLASAMVCHAAYAAGQGAAITYVTKWQPVFLAGREARVAVGLELTSKPKPDLYLVVWVSRQSSLERPVWILYVKPLKDLGLSTGETRHWVSVTLPDSLPAGTAYFHAALSTSPNPEPGAVLSSKSTKVAIADRDLHAISLASVLAQAYKDAQGNPDFAALRGHLLQRAAALPAQVLGPNPAEVDDPVGLADTFLSTGRFPLETGTVRFTPGRSFWSPREHPSDSLQAHSLLFIRVLVTAYDRTRNTAYLDAALALHADWAAHNRIDSYLCSHAWGDHATPLRLRTLVALATRLAQHPRYDRELDLILRDIYRHSSILSEVGFYSYWSNHGLFQDEALIAASVICDVFDRSKEWQRNTLRRVGTWFRGKVAADGALNEGSGTYQLLVLGLALNIRELAAASGASDPELDDLIAQMSFFAKHLIKPDGHLVMFGDTSADLPKAWPVPESNLTAPLRERILRAGQQPGCSLGLFPASGYFFAIADCAQNARGFYFALDYGVSTRATHFQDDTGNFELVLGGETLIQDSGYYDYSDAPINRYYKSPRAHNTIVFGDQSRSPYAQRTIKETAVERYWSSPERFEITVRMVTAEGSQLRRTAIGYPRDQVVVIRDRFRSTSRGGATFFFHYAPEADASLTPSGVALTTPRGSFSHFISCPGRVTLHKGETEPASLGWISCTVGTKQPRWTAAVRFEEQEGELVSVFAPAGTDVARYLSEDGAVR